MIRVLPAVALLACGSNPAGEARTVGGDTADEATIAPPVPCPVGDVMLTPFQAERDQDMLDAWNQIRVADGSCGAVQMDRTNGLAEDSALMWTARCWAHDISVNGPPEVSETFSDGTPIDEVAAGLGYVGILTGFGVQGGHPTPEDALQAWVDAEDESCERLWDDASSGGVGVSRAGGPLVLVRLSGVTVR